MKEELNQKYSKEVCMACESMTYGKRKFTLPQKSRLLENFYKYSKNKQLVGPIADGSSQGYDAVLLRRSQTNSLLQRFADVLVKNENGEIEEKMVHFDFCSARNYPGNHIVIIESKLGIGIYEDTNKNEKELAFKEYESKLRKIGIYKGVHFMFQLVICGVVSVIMGNAYTYVRDEGWYVKFLACFLASLLYPAMLKLTNKYYIKKFGKEIFENLFSHIGISLFILLCLMSVWGAFA